MSLRVMVEIAPGAGCDLRDREAVFRLLRDCGLEPDPTLDPVPMKETGTGAARRPASLVVTGTLADEAALRALSARPEVIEVWRDTPIAPFGE